MGVKSRTLSIAQHPPVPSVTTCAREGAEPVPPPVPAGRAGAGNRARGGDLEALDLTAEA